MNDQQQWQWFMAGVMSTVIVYPLVQVVVKRVFDCIWPTRG